MGESKSVPFQILGAGAGRTGTVSLRNALEMVLPGPVYHMWEVIPRPEHTEIWHEAANGGTVDWHGLFDGWSGTVDFPGSLFVPELMEAFPDALVLLSLRDRDSWWDSADRTILRGMRERPDNRPQPWFEMIQDLMRNRFSNKFSSPDEMMAAFDEHNAFIREIVPADQLLEWRAGDGWEPVCERLGIAVPDIEFPHANAKADWTMKPPDVVLRDLDNR